METSSSKTTALLVHLLAFAGYIVPFGHVLGPLVLWLVKRGDSPFIDAHGKEAVNFQISVTLYMLACIPLIPLAIGGLLMLALMLFDIVCVILAAVRAYSGERCRYPLAIRFL
jgi:uncharacterized Tic20 family protein